MSALSSQFSVLSSQKNQRRTLLRWLKFNAVGGLGIGVQLTALAIFRSWLQFNYLLATGLAVEIAVIHNFLWHERFTWLDRPATRPVESLMRFGRFNATNGAVSLGGNLLFMWVLADGMGMNYVVANLIAVAMCSLVNFLLSDRLVFRGCAELRSGGRAGAPVPT